MLPYVYRPLFGRILTVSVAVICLIGVIWQAIADFGDLWQVLPVLGLITAAVWALFWNPHVRVDADGVLLQNPLRRIVLPWQAIELVDTKWALALRTKAGQYTAWAAPAPSRMAARRLSRTETKGLPESTFAGPGQIRPGDMPGTPSGDVAQVVRREWHDRHDPDAPDVGTGERTEWQWLVLGVLVLLLGLTVVSLTL